MAVLVGVIMGSKSDWPVMSQTCETLQELGIAYEVEVISAHRTPERLCEYATTAIERGLEVIIAAAGGAAHLAGVTAAHTALPVLGVPMESKLAGGLDSLLSMAQMPRGVPVGTLAVGKAGAINAALFACAILGIKHSNYRDAYEAFRREQTENGLADSDPRK